MPPLYHSQFGEIHLVKERLNKFWISVIDLMPALGFKSKEEAIRYVPSKFIKYFSEEVCSVKDGMLAISEAGLVFLIKKSEATYINLFIEWIIDEALPQVRNYEMYYGRYGKPRIKPINLSERSALNKIKCHLKKGDVLRISKLTGKSKSWVSNTMNGLIRNEGVVSLAFNIAIFNKKDGMLEDYYDPDLISEINTRLS